MADRRPDKIDHLVGHRIRECRKASNRSQEFLGNAIGLSDAEIGKIERGENRVSASHFYQISRCLQTDLYYFFMPIKNSLSGHGFEEEPSDWLPKTPVPEFMERVAAILRDIPAKTREELLGAINELVEKVKAQHDERSS